MKIAAYIFFLVAVSALVSCEAKSSEKESTASTVSVKSDVDIHAAVLNSNIEGIKKYIASGADINIKEPMGGSTPLISAAVFNKPEAAKLLIDAGAKLNIKNNDGSTALHSAAFFGRTDIVKMLVDAGIDQSIKNNFGATALQSVEGPYEQLVPLYKQLQRDLGPLGFQLNMDELEDRRAEIAAILK